MTAEAERLLEALCSATVTTAEATGFLGTDALALAVPKPSRATDDPEPTAPPTELP
jgi:hypothetical protein